MSDFFVVYVGEIIPDNDIITISRLFSRDPAAVFYGG